MGNAHPKYLTEREARAALGASFDRLEGQLQKSCEFGSFVDLDLFSSAVSSHFENMPSKLCDCLFMAFVSDIQSRIEIKDFISSLAVILGNADNSLKHRFLFRVYDVHGNGEMDKLVVEKLVMQAYGKNVDKEAAIQEINDIFSHSSHPRYISQKEFESYDGSVEILSGWVRAVLTIFIEHPSSKLSSLEKRYSVALEAEQMMDRFSVDRRICEELRLQFYRHCGYRLDEKAELHEEDWIKWTSDFIVEELAIILFKAKLTGLKTVWRFKEFAEFCMIFGTSFSDEAKAAFICVLFQQYALNCEQRGQQYTLKNSEFVGQPIDPDISDEDDIQLIVTMRKLIQLLSQPSRAILESEANCAQLPVEEAMATQLAQLEQSFLSDNNDKPKPGVNLQAYVSLICNNVAMLPGMQLLSMASCCLFGLRPPTPEHEKIYITELMLWGQAVTRDSQQPHGPEGAEWALISERWWDNWRNFVGRSNSSMHGQPGEIDNYTLIKKSATAAQLLPGTVLKRDFEAVPIQVFTALHHWYGGGPAVVRRVVSGLNRAPGVPREHIGPVSPNEAYHRPLLELFPFCLQVYSCDSSGYAVESHPREFLFSALSTVGSVIEALRFDSSKARLWSYRHSSNLHNDTLWRQHRILAPELTLQDAGLSQESCVLLEVSLSDGSWPKSQLHAQLVMCIDADELNKNKCSDSVTDLPLLGSSPLQSKLTLNMGGRVGLDNLGNTCYLNSSLQALLHTSPLVEFFLNKTHLQEVNLNSKFGFNGKLALAFGKLMADLWLVRQEKDRNGLSAAASNALTSLRNMRLPSSENSVSPRKFRRELMSLHEQFNNNEQHDAQEVLTFLLDGLSEDLNLVHEKPYTELPDSDERPDCVLADIWWQNHLKREHSVMQSLFTGQFKSVTRCTNDECTYHSARFEPFNMLSLPLPDNEQRVMIVMVVLREFRQPIRCAVAVKKSSGTVGDIEDILNSYELDGEADETLDKKRHFLAFKILRRKVVCRYCREDSVDGIRESDDIFFYEVLHGDEVTGNSCISAKRPLSPSQRGESAIRAGPLSKKAVTRETTSPQDSQDSSLVVMPPGESLPLPEDKAEGPSAHHSIKEESGNVAYSPVVFVHRRVHSSSSRGVKMFRMESVGLPLLEVLPSRVSPRSLYAHVESRVKACYKTSIGDLQRRNNSGCDSARPDGQSHVNHIRPIATEDAVGGDIPPYGFVLRLIKKNGYCCSRCHWLNRCEGCLIPYDAPERDEDEQLIELGEMESIAIDWHYIVFHEALESYFDKISVTTHDSVPELREIHNKPLPLSECLRKFTEEEALDDMVCPKCKESDGCLRRSFSIWRLPPFLIIQLKRFQFNSYSRRKLSNQVDFPVEGLNMREFLAPSHSQFVGAGEEDGWQGRVQANGVISGDNETPVALVDLTDPDDAIPKEDGSMDESPCLMPSASNVSEAPESTVYDLYSVVHHVGALGGGHYVASVLDDFDHLNRFISKPPKNNDSETPESSPSRPKWYNYNDSIVTQSSPAEIVNPSAYLLFYSRRDVKTLSVTSLHEHASKPPENVIDLTCKSEDACMTPNDTAGDVVTSQPTSLKPRSRPDGKAEDATENENSQCLLS